MTGLGISLLLIGLLQFVGAMRTTMADTDYRVPMPFWVRVVASSMAACTLAAAGILLGWWG